MGINPVCILALPHELPAATVAAAQGYKYKPVSHLWDFLT